MSEDEIIDRVMMIDQWKTSGDIYTQDELNVIGMLLDLYYKQQKEIEELKADKSINTEIHKRDLRIKELEDINEALHQSDKEDFISKDKIKARIEYLQDNFDLSEMIWNTQDILDELEELLGEENE